MYERINWKDEVRDPDRTFSYTENADGTMTFTRAGIQRQAGTNQNAAHFNQMDEGIEAANIFIDMLFTYIGMKLGFSEHTLESLEAALKSALSDEIKKITSGDTVAKKASVLSASKTFSISGGATASGVAFDGSGNVELKVTALDPAKLSAVTPISKGGTEAKDAAGARANLDVPSNADLNAAAILHSAIECVTQAYQRDLDSRISAIEAGLS